MSPSRRLWVWILSVTVVSQVFAVLFTRQFAWSHWGFLSHLRHAVRTHHLAFAAIALTAIGVACIRFLSQMVLVKARVYNAKGPLILRKRDLPGFIDQNRNSEALTRFRLHLDDVLRVRYPDSLSQVIAIRRWVRHQQSQDKSVWLPRARVNHENPHRLLKEQRDGVPGSCRRFSYILLGALLSAGFRARVVGFASTLNRRESQQHAAVEVWLEELGQWVLLDPTCDTLVLVDGKVASAVDLCETMVSGDLTRIAFQRDGGALGPHPSPELYERYCRHLFVAMSNAVFDGHAVRTIGWKRIRFLHYSREAEYPEFRKQLLLSVGGSGLFLSLVLWAWSLLSLVAQDLAAGLAVRTPVWLLVILSLLVPSPVFEDTLARWSRPWRR